MTTRHTITRADLMFSQSAYYPPFNPVPGLPIDVMNVTKFGAIALASANAISTTGASSGANNALTINGALATAGVATIPTARSIVAAWTTSATITVTGTDLYGQPQTESIAAPAASFTGKKAFATVTAVTFSTAVTAATVGTGVAIGLPFRVDANGLWVAKQTNTIDAATFVPADATSPATSVTGDVRGTVTFASAPDGTKTYSILYSIGDRTGGPPVGTQGTPGYAPAHQVGAFGVPPA